MPAPSRHAPETQGNTHKFREPWLSEAVQKLRPLFAAVDLTIPENLRCTFGLSSSGPKSARKAECWPASASADSTFEIFISPDIADPAEVLGLLCHSLVHACLPSEAGHGPKFRDAAIRVGLHGKMRHAGPGPLLAEALKPIAETLGPLPHGSLDLAGRVLDRPRPADKPKKQGTRLIKAECNGADGEICGYTVRLAAKWIKEVGNPHCPKHGAMTIQTGEAEPETEAPGESV